MEKLEHGNVEEKHNGGWTKNSKVSVDTRLRFHASGLYQWDAIEYIGQSHLGYFEILEIWITQLN